MSKHTPGPWTTQECSNGGMLLLRGQYGKHPQSHLQIVPSEDARLIAAAPELLEALKALRAWHQGEYQSNPAVDARVDAVIAKAEGL